MLPSPIMPKTDVVPSATNALARPSKTFIPADAIPPGADRRRLAADRRRLAAQELVPLRAAGLVDPSPDERRPVAGVEGLRQGAAEILQALDVEAAAAKGVGDLRARHGGQSGAHRPQALTQLLGLDLGKRAVHPGDVDRSGALFGGDADLRRAHQQR